MRHLQLPLVALALACAVPAQEGPLRFVPKGAMFVAQMDAPARWPDTFAETRLGAFLDGPVVQDAIAPLREEMEAALEELRDEGRVEHVDLIDALLAFRGRITFALDVDLVMSDPDAEPEFTGVIALSGGTASELDELAELAERSAEVSADDDGRVIADQVFGDATLRVAEAVGDGTSTWASFPQRIGDDLVMLFWTGERGRIEAWAQLDEGDRYDTSKIPPGPLTVRMSLEQAIAAILEQAESLLPDIGNLFGHIGLLQLRTFELSVATEDEFVAIDFGVSWEGDGGVLEMLVPESQGLPRLLDMTPTNAPSWSVSIARFDVLYDVIAAVWDEVAEMIPLTREDGEDAFEDMFRIRLREDLFDHLGGEILTIADASAFEDPDVDVDDPFSMLAGQGYALELKNAPAFAESFETMLRARGMHAARKTTDYRGFDVHRLKLAGLIDLDYAITDRVFAFSINCEDAAQLRAILDEEASRRAGEPPAPLPEGTKIRLDMMPGGWCGASVTDSDVIFDAFSSSIEQAILAEGFGEVPQEIAEILDVMSRLQVAMRDQGLSKMVSVTWAQPGSVRARLLW